MVAGHKKPKRECEGQVTVGETVRYREPTRADLPGLQVIDAASFRDGYPFFVLRQLLEVASSHSVVAVERGFGDEDAVVGYALTIIGDCARAWLISLAVSPDRRGRGYSRGLLEHSIEVCRQKVDVDEIWVAVEPRNVPAYALFTGFGFVLREHDERYFGGNEPRDVLVYKVHRSFE